ncbi:unnamed protein product [Polarella glacialis]|uniref:Dimethylglycine dehydrogenase n=1 Tax=Polarella glacialis TaxID=89957 RepID=A0A813GD19_POLGL|nr:unnamed protein product [Polarella glacialis]
MFGAMWRLPSYARTFIECAGSPGLRGWKLPRQAKAKAKAFSAASSDAFPDQARVVVVGGGIVGTSVAYELAKQGWDVLLLEQNQLTSGTTWHAAGLMCTFGSKSETSTELRKYTKQLYRSLEAETGQSTGFKPCGFIELATEPDRVEEYRRVAAVNRKFGIDVHELSPAEVKDKFPLCRTDHVFAGWYVPDDGRVNPVDATMALAKGARMYGARIIEGVTVTGITKENGRVTGVKTANGVVKAEFVVNCAGMWARQFGELCGVNVPNQAAEHYYLITDAMPDVDPDWPIIEDPASHTYIRPERGGLMVGLFEPDAAAWNVNRIPGDFSFGEIEPDWDRMSPFLEKAMSLVPRTLEVGMAKFFCGPESFTPDLAPLVGEAPELKNYFVAAGLNSVGILSGPGVGRLVAHWIINGHPDMDVTAINIDRLHRYQGNPQYRAHRVVESLGLVYAAHYPTLSNQTARGVKKSPFHERLAARGAYFKEVSGWEGADWYAPAGVSPRIERHSWKRQNWFPYWAAEHKACREGVVVMDMSFMSNFLVQGRDAGRWLNYISAGNVDNQEGLITYTQWLNDQGTLEADVTVNKLDEHRFLVVVTDTMHRHAETWLRRQIPADAHAFVTDVTSGLSQLNLQGPRSRELLQQITSEDLSNEAFPFRSSREIDIGYARATCVRITYVGELGYELYIPTEQASHVYDKTVEVGPDFGLVHAGLKALNSLRMEKGYRDYGHDMDNTDSLLEVGLSFACDLKKPGGFIGRDAVMAQKAAGPLRKRLLQVLVKDPEPLMFHGEVVLRDGQPVADIRSASYGHTLGGAVGLAMVEAPGHGIDKAYLQSGRWEVDIAGKLYPAEVSLRPMYDPSNSKIKT